MSNKILTNATDQAVDKKIDRGFTFIDLFAGIGGIRIAFEEAGGECVFTSEIDKFARRTYEAYFQDDGDHASAPDITKMDPSEIPNHDVLTGGFPCQPFSIAGVSKKNALGRKHGFEDPTKGTLFFNIKEILLEKKPKAFLLENVKNLRSHDRGNTWRVVEQTLIECGYVITDKILDAAKLVPQHRERVFIVGFHRDHFDIDAHALDFTPFWNSVQEGIERRREELRETYGVPQGSKYPLVGHILEDPKDVPDKYILTPGLWKYLQEYKRKHRAKGNGFGFGMVTADNEYTRTLSARYYKDGSEALVSRGNERPRRLTPLECARLQGFPEDFQKMFSRREAQPSSDTQAYKQFGNSVCVPVVSAIAEELAHLTRRLDRIAGLDPALKQQKLFVG